MESKRMRVVGPVAYIQSTVIRNHLGDLVINERIILKWNLKSQDIRALTGLI
jgi:hypothetical protein